MEKRQELYAGKAKSVFATDDPDRVILQFRDDTSAFDGERMESLARKGMVNNRFNAFIMETLAEAGVGWWLPEPEFTPERLASLLGELFASTIKLPQAAAVAASMGRPQAAASLADLVERMLQPDREH